MFITEQKRPASIGEVVWHGDTRTVKIRIEVHQGRESHWEDRTFKQNELVRVKRRKV